MKGGRKRVKGEGVSERTIEGERWGLEGKADGKCKKQKEKENIEKGKGGAERHNERGEKERNDSGDRKRIRASVCAWGRCV